MKSDNLLGAMFPLPRLLYSMSCDGLLHHLLARVNSRKIPVVATLVPAVVIAILAGILELNELMMMMCIGTLLSYTMVAACVILLRYRSPYAVAGASAARAALGCGPRAATAASALVVSVALVLFAMTCATAALVAAHVRAPTVLLAVLHAAALLLIIVMTLQPQNNEQISFKTPLVPIVPCLSIYVNIHLMILINGQTWIRVAIWMAVGIPVYILCTCLYKRNDKGNLQNNLKTPAYVIENGKPIVQIIVETPTPPGTTSRSNVAGDHNTTGDEPNQTIALVEEKIVRNQPIITEEIIVQHSYVEDNEEKEAKIIDLLDQVLQAEEDSYGEVISLKEPTEDDVISTMHKTIVHRKSLGELSDAGSDASMGNQVLSKYDVIAQVHREDLPKVNEEDEVIDSHADLRGHGDELNEPEEVTAFDDSDTNSRTDESGYSDTLDRVNEPGEDMKQETFYIPVPPPLDENYFKSPAFKKSYTVTARSTKSLEFEEQSKPRESIQSNNSQDDGTMIFGSDKQINFMSKLENLFQNKMSNTNQNEEQRKRSHSTGNVVENTEFPMAQDRPSVFLDLKKELLSKEAQNLKPIVTEDIQTTEPEPEEPENASLSREDLKSKLESIFAAGGPLLLKPRLMKSNPPTPEEAYQTDSSTESIPKLPKMEKNDTLKRQKDKYGEVLNSFRLSLNKDDEV